MKLDRARVYVYMAKAGLTQQDIRQRTGIAQATLSRAVNGISQPKPKTAQKIAEALDVSVMDILEGTGK